MRESNEKEAITSLANLQILRQFPFIVSQLASTLANQFPQSDNPNIDKDDDVALKSTSRSPKMSA
jgi:hypothetical protein